MPFAMQTRTVGILKVFDDAKLASLIVWGPRGFVKDCGSLVAAFRFLAAEFEAIGNDEAARNAFETLKISTREGHRLARDEDLIGEIIAISEKPGEPERFYGFDAFGLRVVRNRDLDVVTEALRKPTYESQGFPW